MNAFNLENKIALITGGGSGLGFGIAQTFIKAGGTVVIVGKDEQKLIHATQILGPNSKYIQCDITHLKTLPSLIEKIEKEIGEIEILVNNAGKHLKEKVEHTTDEAFEDILRVHLLSSFALSREVGKYMMQRKRGAIVMISSMSAVMSMDSVVAYSTAKTAVIGLMRGLLAEFSGYNIRVNTIAPGWIDTPMLHVAIDNDLPRKNKIINRIPTHDFGKPEDIGYAALYLCSAASRYVNGVFLPVDGGAVSGF